MIDPAMLFNNLIDAGFDGFRIGHVGIVGRDVGDAGAESEQCVMRAHPVSRKTNRSALGFSVLKASISSRVCFWASSSATAS